MRCRRQLLALVPLLLSACSAAAQSAAPAAPAPARPPAGQTSAPGYASDPRFQDALKQAKSMSLGRDLLFAADAYKKANKLAGGQCAECLKGMYDAQMKTGDFRGAVASAAALEAVVTLPMVKSHVARLQAEAILAQAGEKPKPAQLQAADAALKQALSLYPKNAGAMFLDGKVLAQLGKMDEARAQFTDCVQCVSPKDPARLRAQHFAENPSLATQKMAPPFEVVALNGEKFNLDAMGGRVVLIDFWATWCGPCNEELPHMRKIAKEFAGQPLVIISVSWDKDEAAWKSFIGKNEMTWVQYRDADQALSKAFGIQSIPHYFTIDSDGVLTSEMVGSGSDVEGRLKKLVARAREAQTITASATGN